MFYLQTGVVFFLMYANLVNVFNFAVGCFVPPACKVVQEPALPKKPVPESRPAGLEPGRSFDREIKAGESHSYQIQLKENQYCRVVVEHKGIDLNMQVFSPALQMITESDSLVGSSESGKIAWIATQSGTYQFEVRVVKEAQVPGSYQVWIEELRAATGTDPSRIAAQKAFLAAQRQHGKKTPESLKKAIQLYQEAIQQFQEAADRNIEVTAYNAMGQAFQALSDFPSALKAYQQALSLSQELHDPLGEAAALNNLGSAYNRWGAPQNAVSYLEQALVLTQKHGLRQKEGRVRLNLGNSYGVLGKTQLAVEHYQGALALHREFGEKQGEVDVLNSLGVTYRTMGQWQQAIECYTQALSLCKTLNDRRQQATCLNNLGAVQAALQEPQKAMEYYSQALSLVHEVGDRQAEPAILTNIGAVYSILNKQAEALQHYKQALEIIQALGGQSGQITMLNNVGRAYHLLGEFNQALEYYGQSLQLARKTGDQSSEALVLSNLGTTTQALGDKKQAGDYFQQALALRQVLGNPVDEAASQFDLAQLRQQEGQLAEAFELTEAGFRRIELLQVGLDRRDLRGAYFAKVQRRFDFYIQLLMDLHRQKPTQGFDQRALIVSEQSRALLLVEQLKAFHAKINQQVAPELLAQEQALQEQLNARIESLTRLNSRKHTPEQAAPLKQDVEKINSELQQVQVRIRKENPRYAALKYPKAYSLAEIQEKALDSNTILLEYALGDKESYLWVVTSNSLTSHVLPGREEIERIALNVYQLITAREPRPFETESEIAARVKQADVEFPAAAAELSRILLGPVADQLGRKRLLIVGDGVLQYLPFAALPEPQKTRPETRKSEAGLIPKGSRTDSVVSAQSSARNPLVVAHEIVMLPSASTLLVEREERRERDKRPQTIAMFANPVFSAADPRIQSLNNGAAQALATGTPGVPDRFLSPTVNLEPVPETEVMAKEILALIPSGEGKLATGFDANLKAATAPELSQYRFLHFATHGFLHSDPELSGVVLSLVDREGKPQPGFLTTSSLYNLKLSADLVVLSSCQSGLALDFTETKGVNRVLALRKVKGQGLTGLARGFLYAGAERLAVSLWNIRVKGTRELMNRFYTGMLGPQKLSPAAALRAAQVAMWKESKWNAPYYWAGFVLIGEYH